MFSLFRKKTKDLRKEVTAGELANALIHIVKGSERSNQALSQLLQNPDDADKKRFLDEAVYLRIFAIDTAVINALGETPEMDGVLGPFYDHIKKLFDSHGGSLWKNLEVRLFTYKEAFKTPHHRGSAFQVGKAFAGFCGYEMDAVVMLAGSAEFTGTVATVSDLVKSFHIRA